MVQLHPLPQKKQHKTEPHLEVLAQLAVHALIQGLVNPGDSGAYQDMNLAILLQSANALYPGLLPMAQVCHKQDASSSLRYQLGQIGRNTEQDMYAATNGVNTHKDAI